MEFKEIVEKRYACKLFTGEKIPEEKIDELLEYIRLAPSSFGLQPFVVIVVTDQALKEKLEPASHGQKQITTCSHLLVFCANTNVDDHIDKIGDMKVAAGMEEDKVKPYVDMMRGAIHSKSKEQLLFWAQKQIYIALSNALNGATALGFDSCPMEGFEPEKYKEVLELPDHLVPTVLAPVGYAADETRKKVRYSKEELFQFR